MSREIVLISPDSVLVRTVQRAAEAQGVRCETFPSIAEFRGRSFGPSASPQAILFDGPARELAPPRRWSEADGPAPRLFRLAGGATDAAAPADWGFESGAVVPRPRSEAEAAGLLVRVIGETAAWACARDAGSWLDALVGRSVAFRTVLDAALRAAAADGPVLLTGEPGTGRRLFARAIHGEGARASQPFVTLRAEGLPQGALERVWSASRTQSRVTGADPSPLPRAEGGTLYLEDVTALSGPVQAELLALLDSWELARAQGLRGGLTDVRLIASAREPLADAVARAHFRSDLAGRLTANTIRIPSLRERPSDVLLLAEHFLGEYARRSECATMRLGDGAKQLLASYRWPGNIPELAGVLRLAAGRAGTAAEIGVAELPEWVRTPQRVEQAVVTENAAGAATGARVIGSGGILTQRFVDGAVVIELPEEGIAFLELERAILRAALERTRGNVVRAARLLRLGRGSLRYRLEKHGIVQPKRRRAARRRAVKETATEALRQAS
jgi:DNA-binding NtrC family response regulator